MVELFETVSCITEKDIQVGDVVSVDFCDSLYTVYEVEDDQVRTDGFDGSYWIDLAYIESVEKQALKTKKEDDKKMEFNVNLTESQLQELLKSVDVSGYVQYMDMDEWNEYMDGTPATEIIDIISGSFYTGDAFAYFDGGGLWNSADDIEEILEPYIEDIFNDYLHFYL